MRFLFVDEIVEMTPGRDIHARTMIPGDAELFRDHFPGFAVVPGVLLIEMMAQSAGKCLDAAATAQGKAMLAQVRHSSFRRWVRPDQPVDIHARITASGPQAAAAACHVSVDGQEVADAELFFVFLPLSELTADFRDTALEEFRRRTADRTRTT
jgi:3-hydroxyacyl-[acyl-carrier-protein] dehydratase